MRVPLKSCSLRLVVAAFIAMAALATQAAAARSAEPGTIKVEGTTTDISASFNLDEVKEGRVTVPGDGSEGWPLRQILLFAAEKTGAFEIEDLKDPIEVARTAGQTLKVSRSMVSSSANDLKLPIYFLDADGNTRMWQPKGPVLKFTTAPQIFISKAKTKLSVDIKPDGPIRVKAGGSKSFTAAVENPSQIPVELVWTVNGNEKQSGGSAGNGQFEFEFRDEGTYEIAVFANADGQEGDFDTVKVIVGKAKKKKKKDESDPPDDSGNYDPGYVPGYNDYDYYDDGSGTGTGTSSNGSPSPSGQNRQKKKQDKEPTPVDDGLETVSGELIDPGATATVIPPADSPSGGGEEAKPADDEKGGGGISKGAATALGIGALLGLGGLLEAGAFTGFGRFRFRP